MTADNRKENTIILGVFLICLLALVAFNLLPGRPGQGARVKSSLRLPPLAGVTAAGLSPAPEEAGETGVREVWSDWGRDPFKPLEFSDADADQDMDMQFAEDDFKPAGEVPIQISLILISEAGKSVTVNGRIYKVGDEILGEKIVEIKENGIVLANNEVRRFVPLRDTAVRFELQNEKQKAR